MKHLKILLPLCVAAGLVVALRAQEKSKEPSPADIVARQLAAFNRHDPAALARGVTEDFRWYSVGSDNTKIATEGREKFLSGMKDYFKSFPSVSSRVDGVTPSGTFVSFRETASWTNKNGLQSQESLGVYEIQEGLIKRVWYFPASR